MLAIYIPQTFSQHQRLDLSGGRCIIFVDTTREARTLLSHPALGHRAKAVHNESSPQDRDRTLTAFANLEPLVTTCNNSSQCVTFWWATWITPPDYEESERGCFGIFLVFLSRARLHCDEDTLALTDEQCHSLNHRNMKARDLDIVREVSMLKLCTLHVDGFARHDMAHAIHHNMDCQMIL